MKRADVSRRDRATRLTEKTPGYGKLFTKEQVGQRPSDILRKQIDGYIRTNNRIDQLKSIQKNPATPTIEKERAKGQLQKTLQHRKEYDAKRMQQAAQRRQGLRFNPNVKLDPSQVIDSRKSSQSVSRTSAHTGTTTADRQAAAKRRLFLKKGKY